MIADFSLNIGNTIYQSHKMRDGSIVTEELTIENDYERSIFQFGVKNGTVFLSKREAEEAVAEED